MVRKISKLLRKIRISTKILGGFGVVLLLLLVVGYVGLRGMSGTTQRTDQAEAINRMVKLMQSAQQNEKDFVIYGDEGHAKKVDADVADLIDQGKRIKKNLDLDADNKKIDQILFRAEAFRSAFHQYVIAENEKATLMVNMQEKAGDAITKLEKIGQDQIFQLGNVIYKLSTARDGDIDVDWARNIMDSVGSRVTTADDANRMIKWFLEARKSEKELIITGDRNYFETVLGIIEKTAALGDTLKTSFEAEADVKNVASAMAALTLYDAAFKEFATKMEEQEKIDQDLVKAARATQAVCDELWAQQRNLMASEIKLSNVAIYLICGFALAIGGAVAAWVTLSIRKSIGYAVGIVTQVADGDLTETIEVKSKDEIGDLLTAMQRMVDNLHKMLRDILSGVDTLASSSTELSNISTQLAAGSEHSSEKSATVVAGAEEMSGNMNSVAAAAEQASQNVGMVSDAAEEMAGTIDEIVQNTEKGRDISAKAVEKATGASEKMAYLGKTAQEVGNVTEAIAEISEQTNLLALNATIEAARAGEAGKGFAVVANEIKELAKQTAEATLQIRNQIEGIQNSTESTIAEIQEVTTVIRAVDDVVGNIASAIEQQSGATKEISNSVAQASLGIQEVTENVTQSSVVASTISTEISGVNCSVQEIAAASSQVQISSDDLSTLSDQLKAMASGFRLH